VLSAFSTDRPCDRKANRPPDNESLAEVARLRAQKAERSSSTSPAMRSSRRSSRERSLDPRASSSSDA